MDNVNNNNNNHQPSGDEGAYYLNAVYGPFNTIAAREFTAAHVPGDITKDYELGDLLHGIRLGNDDMTKLSLGIDARTQPLPVDDQNKVKAWDPYSRQWWDFEVVDAAGFPKLKGWRSYRVFHDLKAGDLVNFKAASRPDGVEFVIIEFTRTNPTTPNHPIPFPAMP